MNQTSKNLPRRNQAQLDAEIERIVQEQGVKPYNFDEAVKDLTDEWTDKDETAFEKFMEWRQQEREADKRAQKKEW